MKNTTKNWHTKIINQCQCLILIVLKYCCFCFCSCCCGFGVCRCCFCCWSSCCFIIIFTQIVEYGKIGIYEVFNSDEGGGIVGEKIHSVSDLRAPLVNELDGRTNLLYRDNTPQTVSGTILTKGFIQPLPFPSSSSCGYKFISLRLKLFMGNS